MKEFESLLKVVSEGLKTLANGVGTLAEKVDEYAKSQAAQKRTSAAPPPAPAPTDGKRTGKGETAAQAQKPGTGKGPAKAGSAARAKKATPTAPLTTTAVFNIVKTARTGVDTAAIKAKTGLNPRQVSNAIYKLKKAGKIKSAGRGTYIKA